MDNKIKIDLSGIGTIECSCREVAYELRIIVLDACARSADMSSYCISKSAYETSEIYNQEYDQRMNWYEEICEVLSNEDQH